MKKFLVIVIMCSLVSFGCPVCPSFSCFMDGKCDEYKRGFDKAHQEYMDCSESKCSPEMKENIKEKKDAYESAIKTRCGSEEYWYLTPIISVASLIISIGSCIIACLTYRTRANNSFQKIQ
jgi:hypothetical protein